MLDAVQDPVNLGTIVRTADAAGLMRFVLGRGRLVYITTKFFAPCKEVIFIPFSSELTRILANTQRRVFKWLLQHCIRFLFQSYKNSRCVVG